MNANKQHHNESGYQEGIMNYQLKIGTKSEEIHLNKIYKYHPKRLLRFYFDVNSGPLKSLEARYSKETTSPPTSPESAEENDPWGYVIYPD